MEQGREVPLVQGLRGISAVRKPYIKAVALAPRDAKAELPEDLELCRFRKVELPHLHRRYNHVERFLSAGADGDTHGFDLR
jgi:hypothetical protein